MNHEFEGEGKGRNSRKEKEKGWEKQINKCQNKNFTSLPYPSFSLFCTYL